MARKRKSSSGTFLVLFLIISGLSVWHTQQNWREASPVLQEPSESDGEIDVYDISGLNDTDDDEGLFNLKNQILETSLTTDKLESAKNAVVKITSPWAEGYGFFISNRGHILTSKSLISFTEDDKNPVWRKQQKFKRELERHNQNIESLEYNLENSDLSDWQITRTEDKLEKYRKKAEEIEEKLDEYDADIEVTAVDGTELDVSYVNESETYDLALLTIENIRSPFLIPVTSWPSKQFFRNLLDQKEKIYTIGNEPNNSITITRSLIFKLRAEEKCCYSLQHKDVISFSSTGSPLVNSQGEVLGISNVKSYSGKAVPILTALDEFQTALGLGQEDY